MMTNLAVSEEATDTGGRQLPAGEVAYAEINIGDWYCTEKLTITAEHIDNYAQLTNDHFAIHMDTQHAQDHGFNERVAHGLLIMGLTDGLKNNAQTKLAAIATRAWSWDFAQPVLVGDTIYVKITLVGKRLTKTNGQGLLELGFEVINQHEQVAQHGTNTLLVNT